MNSSVFDIRLFPSCRLAVSCLLVLAGLVLQNASSLAQQTNDQNSIVRFEIQRGTNSLGVVDVELFDYEKPETVRNFLLYVRSEAYTNSFLHRCVPGFIVQGGGFSTTNPTSADRFSSYNTVTNLGRLTNEFLVGTRMSNVFGTLAMAKVGDDPNSATSQWFFNLADNTSNLDNQNGGFTVFGRVLQTTNSSDGTNVLEHFNRLSTNAGIVNLASLLGSSFQVFSSLPVSYTNTVNRVPLNRELYYVSISVLNETKPPGTSAPAITVTSPAPNALFTNQTVVIHGTATDDVEVARVLYRLGDGPREIAQGTSDWAVPLSPSPGFQTVTVESLDWDGNFSPAAVVNFFYQKTLPLQLEVVGKGTVAGVTNGEPLVAGASYTATALPQSGSIFQGWTGSITSAAPTISFLAPTNATNFSLTAKFITDPTPILSGTYHGLFQTLGPLDFDGAGFMSLTMQSDGTFSGQILYHGVAYQYTGKFDASGNATLFGPVGGINRTISLTLQKLNEEGLITGSFSGTSSTTLITLERLASSLTANNPPVGSYTFVIPNNSTSSPSALVPGGSGFGTGNLASSGALTLSGSLGDGTSIRITNRMTRLGKWPLYINLDGGKGALWGWITYNTNQLPKLQGTLNWIRTLNGATPLYPSGFSNSVSFVCSTYAPPTPGVRVLNWVHGIARINGTDLNTPLTNTVKLTTNNTLQVLDPNVGQMQLSIDHPTGLVNGSFVHPWFGGSNVLSGSLLSVSNYVRGQYRNGSQIGSFTVDVSPVLVTQAISSVSLPALELAMSEGGVLQFQSSGEILITNPLSTQFDTRLEANGHSVVLRGTGTNRLFEVSTNKALGAVGLTFMDGFYAGASGTNGSSPSSGEDGFGGTFINLGGDLALTNCIITNSVVRGGDAGLDSTTNFVRTAGGRALGAAIYNRGGSLTLHDTVIRDGRAIGGQNRTDAKSLPVATNAAVAMGGAVFSEGGNVRIVDCLFENNFAKGGEPSLMEPGAPARAGDAVGGALAIGSGTLRMINSRALTNFVLGPTTPYSGGSGHALAGALYLETNVSAVVETTVFAANSAGAGSFAQSPEAPNAEGGAVVNRGSLNLTNCTFELNRALGGSSSPAGSGRGGALASFGPVTVNGCSFGENTAKGGQFTGTPGSAVPGGDGLGGAVFLLSTTMAITNSTFAYNLAIGGSGASPTGPTDAPRGAGQGGALMLSSSSASLAHVTVGFNEAAAGLLGTAESGGAFGGGMLNQGGTVNLRSCVVATNSPLNLAGTFTDLGYNISSDISFSLAGAGSLTNRDPVISSLFVTNGGPTRTLALLPSSPARDAVRGSWPSMDQRGTSRPQGAYADSGAFEYVQTLPVFTVQPSGTNNARIGTNITYQAQATGPGTIAYYWLKDLEPIPGATNTVLTLTNVQPQSAGRYAAVATNSFGMTTSTVATLVIDLRPNILTQPSDLMISPGANTSIVVVASGPSLSYAWFRNQTAVSGATNASYPILAAAPGAEGAYQVVITNDAGSVTSRVAAVTWSTAALSILTHPQNTTVGLGNPSSIRVLVGGVSPIAYQWYKNNVPLADATNDFIAFASTTRTNAANYRVQVTNPFLSITSSNAVLTVVAQPELGISSQNSTSINVVCFGDPGRSHRLLISTNPASSLTWIPVATNTMPGAGSILWTFPRATNTGPVLFQAVTP